MQVAHVRELQGNGTLLRAFLSRDAAKAIRKVSGDLLFDDAGNVDQDSDWLFDWELRDEDCYARRMQRAKLFIGGFDLTPSSNYKERV